MFTKKLRACYYSLHNLCPHTAEDATIYMAIYEYSVKSRRNCNCECSMDIVSYLPKAVTVEPEKHPFLGNGCVKTNNGVTVGSGVFCVIRVEII
jgi:hypothetical protein